VGLRGPGVKTESPVGNDGFVVELALIAALILLNAFFAGRDGGGERPHRAPAGPGGGRPPAGAAALRLKLDPDRFLATVQVGVTLVGTLPPRLAASPPSSGSSRDRGAALALAEALAEPLAVAIVVFTIAYLSLVVGELVPKSLAVRHAETLSLWVAP